MCDQNLFLLVAGAETYFRSCLSQHKLFTFHNDAIQTGLVLPYLNTIKKAWNSVLGC